MVGWVAKARCGHTVGGSCAEAYLPVTGQNAWCETCNEGSYLVDIVTTVPQRDSKGFS